LTERSIEVTAETPLGLAAQATIGRLVAQMMENLPGTRKGTDIEALHDMRVASRRLRSALRGFQTCFTPDILAPVVAEVSSVTQALGEARDKDVLIDYLTTFAKDHPELSVDWIIEREERARDGARLRLLDELDRIEEADMPAVISSLLEHAQFTVKNGTGHSFASEAEPLVSHRWDKLKSLGKAISDPANVAELHLMRIGAKRLRYSMELFVPAFGNEMSDLIAEVKLLQEELGTIHDCDVWIEKLKAYRSEPKLAPDRKAGVDALIEDRTTRRKATYVEALAHWQRLEKSGFEKRLLKLVTVKPAKAKGADKVEKVPEEVVTETAAQETSRPRATRKKKVDEKPPTAVELTRASLSQAAEKFAGSKPADKLAKQLDKLKPALDELPEGDKTDKRLAKLRELIESMPENNKLSAKKADKLADELRDIRKKLSAKDGS
jgi:CHAD domain-containing protein